MKAISLKKKYICEKNEGQNISPHLIITNVPKNTKSMLLIVEDPDAKAVVGKTFIHLIAQLDANVRNLPEGSFNAKQHKQVKELFKNDSKNKEYHGPCPPQGPVHHYIFSLIALDKGFELDDKVSPDYFRDTWSKNSKFYNEWKNNIIGEPAMLKGKYQEK